MSHTARNSTWLTQVLGGSEESRRVLLKDVHLLVQHLSIFIYTSELCLLSDQQVHDTSPLLDVSHITHKKEGFGLSQRSTTCFHAH